MYVCLFFCLPKNKVYSNKRLEAGLFLSVKLVPETKSNSPSLGDHSVLRFAIELISLILFTQKMLLYHMIPHLEK